MDSFDALLQLTPHPVLLADESGTVLDANDPAEEALGVDAPTLDGLALPTLFDPAGDPPDRLEPPFPEDRARRLPAEATVPTGEDAVPVDLALASETVDGTRRVVVSLHPEDEGADERPAAPSTAPSNADGSDRYRDLLASSPAPIVIYDATGEIVYANAAAASLLDEPSPDALVGTLAIEYIHPEDRDDSRAGRETVIEGGETVAGVERRLRTADGETRHVVLSAVPATFEGEPAGQVVLSDVTALKERERELERQNERLDRFASIVSHDLRNPLTVLSSSLELAAEVDDPEEHVARARRATDRMEQLIDGLLTIARQGETPVETAPVSLADVAEDAWATVDTADATLSVRVTGTVDADRSRLRELLENLFRNSVDHAGPDVTVTVDATEDGFAVTDDGPGIDAADREAVFENGYSTAGGTGLGLAIVREIAEAHGWEVALTESEAGGVRFEFVGALVR